MNNQRILIIQKVITHIILSNTLILANNNQNNYNSNPETKRKSKKESKNILNIDFDNPSPKKIHIQTPRSKQSLLELGLTENDLFKIDIKHYLLMNPELKTESKEIQEKRYEHYEEKRKQALKEAIKKREEIISEEKEKNKNNFNNTKYSNNRNNKSFFNTQSKFNNNTTRCNSVYHTKRTKNNEFNGMIKKELEKLNLIKKQQIGEIKNLIDYEYFLDEIKKKINKKKLKKN